MNPNEIDCLLDQAVSEIRKLQDAAQHPLQNTTDDYEALIQLLQNAKNQRSEVSLGRHMKSVSLLVADSYPHVLASAPALRRVLAEAEKPEVRARTVSLLLRSFSGVLGIGISAVGQLILYLAICFTIYDPTISKKLLAVAPAFVPVLFGFYFIYKGFLTEDLDDEGVTGYVKALRKAVVVELVIAAIWIALWFLLRLLLKTYASNGPPLH